MKPEASPTSLPQTLSPAGAVQENSLPASAEKPEKFRAVQYPLVQPKLTVGAPDDPYEKEADDVADKVMRMPEQNFVQRKCAHCEEEERIQKSPFSSSTSPVVQINNEGNASSDFVADGINSSRGSGSSLDNPTQSFMAKRFGTDFKDVKIHTGKESAQLSQRLNAKAFTVGKDIYFNQGQYNVNSFAGKQLLAHELTHVVQQTRPESTGDLHHEEDRSPSSASPQPDIMRSSIFNSTTEICHRVLRSRTFNVTSGGLVVQMESWVSDPENDLCRDHSFRITLTENEDWGFDDEFGTCEFSTGSLERKVWAGIPNGNYYLNIWRLYDNPNCCLEGRISVFDEQGLGGESCTDYPDTALEKLHSVLDIAGLVPALGIIPDAINGAIYAIEGDWAGAGISAVAMIPVLGEGAALTRTGVRVSRSTVQRASRESLEAGIRETRAGRGVLSDLSHSEIDELAEGITSGRVRSDALLQLQPHGNARANREALGLSGYTTQSAHFGPQSALRTVSDYNPNITLTRLMSRSSHSAIDAHWRREFQRMASTGATRITAQQLYDVVSDSIRRSGIPADEVASMIARLSDELFVELRLHADDLVRLPYSR